ncbi:hypothetical protein PIB30_018007 [Stylosanthes scabra]|uniref:Uncharacterized protein n=1 Tax=Stylosanthes scabra TaxID=79078 RepID=A0ABU6V9E3_9FABA|nr:hypothetical protein [Stylosanthes scabra]
MRHHVSKLILCQMKQKVKLEEEISEALEDLNEVDKAIGESVVQAGDEGLTIWQNKHSMRQLKDNLTCWTSDLPEDVG